MKIDEHYRGYRISYQRRNRFAYIWPPNGNLALNEIPRVGNGEGLAALRERAFAVIDQDVEQA